VATPIYLDCAATTPLDPRVWEAMQRFFVDEFGNSGSRTHEWGQRARTAVEHARDQVAAVAGSSRGDVIFTSGATESNNLAIFGLVGPGSRPVHVVATAIEHPAVLEPVLELRRRGCEVTLVQPNPDGVVDAARVLDAVRPDTRLVTVMHVNNETGVIQPIAEIADGLPDRSLYFHVDAAQSFARAVDGLRHPRIDLISASAHKIRGPKGVGALISRRRSGERAPLEPLVHGGGQERGLRSGTVPVPLVVGFGIAAEAAAREATSRAAACARFGEALVEGLSPLAPLVNGDRRRAVPYIINLTIPGTAAEVAMDAWRDLVAVSNGSACTTQRQTCSHVLEAMRLPSWRSDGAIRFSWDAETPEPAWSELVVAIQRLHVHPEAAQS
jgi:cysteine desulfurase